MTILHNWANYDMNDTSAPEIKLPRSTSHYRLMYSYIHYSTVDPNLDQMVNLFSENARINIIENEGKRIRIGKNKDKFRSQITKKIIRRVKKENPQILRILYDMSQRSSQCELETEISVNNSHYHLFTTYVFKFEACEAQRIKIRSVTINTTKAFLESSILESTELIPFNETKKYKKMSEFFHASPGIFGSSLEKRSLLIADYMQYYFSRNGVPVTQKKCKKDYLSLTQKIDRLYQGSFPEILKVQFTPFAEPPSYDYLIKRKSEEVMCSNLGISVLYFDEDLKVGGQNLSIIQADLSKSKYTEIN